MKIENIKKAEKIIENLKEMEKFVSFMKNGCTLSLVAEEGFFFERKMWFTTNCHLDNDYCDVIKSEIVKILEHKINKDKQELETL